MISVTRIFCFAIVAGISVISTRTTCPKACGYNYEPVCGSNGKTYSNQCLLDEAVECGNQQITKVNDRACKEECPKRCGENLYEPVCGSDGKTYENNCIFEDAVTCQNLQITKVHDGACQQDLCNLPPETGFCLAHFKHWHYDAAAGTCKEFVYGGCHGNRNNFVTKAQCLAACHKNKKGCPKLCGENLLEPVCGSDGKTYENNCIFEDAVTCQNLQITKTHDGSCEEGMKKSFVRKVLQVNEGCQKKNLTSYLCAAAKKTVEVVNAVKAQKKIWKKVLKENEERCSGTDATSDICVLLKKAIEAKNGADERCNRTDGTSDICLALKKAIGSKKGTHGRCNGADGVSAICVALKMVIKAMNGTEDKCVEKTAECWAIRKNYWKTVTKAFKLMKVEDLCNLPPDTGFCRAYFKHWHYDATANTCKEFIYGGCHGNKNNFVTKESCLKTCRKLKRKSS